MVDGLLAGVILQQLQGFGDGVFRPTIKIGNSNSMKPKIPPIMLNEIEAE